MKRPDPHLIVRPAPFSRSAMTTQQAMRDVLYALMPAIGAALWFFGLSAALVLAATVGGAIVTEKLFTSASKDIRIRTDASTLVTGLLLGVTLPPTLPLWIAFVGGSAAIGLGKLVWGGLGQNLFNPALVGRAFLMAAFPIAMTTWVPHGGSDSFFSVYSSNFAMPLMSASIDGTTTATPLALIKFHHETPQLLPLFLGNVPGSSGETSGLLILLGGVYLLLRQVIDWRILGGVLGSVAILSGLLYLFDPTRYPDPLVTLLSGGLLFGAVFMATDPATSPTTPKGALFFGIGIGMLVVLIRSFGGYPEGVMYAILLMNAATPLIERLTQPRAFGRGEDL
uniref:Ion-translocating oxidoreductase complex subunit D n=1 Tax=Candidatus Kentrum sp. TUN TaxID=2126343 RepID=A0A450ZLJ8_9GAMM|nr:MAG: electron transport complex protein RnfD [Candidatus Kentron sp. TUN]VFK56995.1 MAG: electron transport complex protein RnfD [Candidatus Kentron sp. TUN]VFK59327.1 MAG: electron transport complex protein RnfD [Candidatus Kentron sp. TUN]